MRLVSHTAAFLAGCGLAAAVPRGHLNNKRWNYDVCNNDCSLAGVAMPDQNTFGLPLESFWSEQCPPVVVGQYDTPLSTSTVCLTFSGPALNFAFAPFPGYTLKSAVVTWKVKGNVDDSANWSLPPPTTNILCNQAAGGAYTCSLPFASILGVPPTTSIVDLMGGMCPNGDREALVFYLQLSGLVEPVGGGPAIPFVQQYPCTSRDGNRQCTAWDTSYPYIEVAYRCTNCYVSACPPTSTPPVETPPTSTTPCKTSTEPTPTSSTPPPPLKTCGLGTAFGYQNSDKSIELNTQSGQGCNRWGWYETPTLAELQAGISGPLFVGAGGNDIGKAIEVGSWTALASPTGGVTVTYLLSSGYAISEAHIDLACLPIDKCAPGQYTFNAGSIPNAPVFANPTPLQYPTCSGGSKAALIIHAAVNVLTSDATCSPPKAV